MKRFKGLFLIKLVILLCFSVFFATCNTAVTAFADSPAPEFSYRIELEDGNKFFYMRGMDYLRDIDEEFLDLESGLYYADTLENIYTIQQYIYQTSLVISLDGVYLANLPWTISQGIGCASKTGVAIEFFKNGSLVKQYNLSDLTINRIGFQFSVSHVTWENCNKRSFDAENNILKVRTLNNKTIVFDLTTGSKKASASYIATIVIASVLCASALAGIVFLIYRANKKKNKLSS